MMQSLLKKLGNGLNTIENAIAAGIHTFETQYPNVDLKAIGVFSSSLLFLRNILQYHFLGRVLISTGMMVAAFFINKSDDTRLSKLVNLGAAIATGTLLVLGGPVMCATIAIAAGIYAGITRIYRSPQHPYARTLAQIIIPAALFAAPYEMGFLALAGLMVKCSVDYYHNHEAPSLFSAATNLWGGTKGMFFSNQPANANTSAPASTSVVDAVPGSKNTSTPGGNPASN